MNPVKKIYDDFFHRWLTWKWERAEPALVLYLGGLAPPALSASSTIEHTVYAIDLGPQSRLLVFVCVGNVVGCAVALGRLFLIHLPLFP